MPIADVETYLDLGNVVAKPPSSFSRLYPWWTMESGEVPWLEHRPCQCMIGKAVVLNRSM